MSSVAEHFVLLPIWSSSIASFLLFKQGVHALKEMTLSGKKKKKMVPLLMKNLSGKFCGKCPRGAGGHQDEQGQHQDLAVKAAKRILSCVR